MNNDLREPILEERINPGLVNTAVIIFKVGNTMLI